MVGVTLAACTGVALGAIPDSGGVIHACYNKTNGKIRVTDAQNPKLGACLAATETALNWNQQGPAGALGATDRTFVVSGFSKTYAMTGWRLGWLVCPNELAPVAASLQEPVTSCASTIAQKAAEAALDGDQAVVKSFRDSYRRRRDIVVDVFGNTQLLPLIPEGAFYALIDVGSTGRRSLDFARDLLARCDTAVVPGITFGPSCDRYVRIAFTIAEDDLRTGLQRLRSHIEALRDKGASQMERDSHP